MYEHLSALTLAAFFALPPLVFAIRYFRASLVNRWAALAIVLLGCWLLLHASTTLHYWHLDALVIDQPDVPQALIDRWANDGSKKTLVALLGWLFGLIYAIPYYAIYRLALWRRSNRAAETQATP